MILPAHALHWLPPCPDLDRRLAALKADHGRADGLAEAMALANTRLDFLQTRRLDGIVQKLPEEVWSGRPRLRVTLLGTGTMEHLPPGIRVAALRRGLRVDCAVSGYGQWRQDILDPGSPLAAAKPDVLLLAVDPAELLPELPLSASAEDAAQAVEAVAEEVVGLWRRARERTGAAIIHQAMPLNEPATFGHLERLVPASRGALAAALDAKLVEAAARERVLLLDLRTALAEIGAREVGDLRLWHHAKQAISPAATPWYGEQVGRILAALRGLSKKVLVLDLDNTLWGGVIGDDGLAGIVLGQGSATGEAFVAFQRHVHRLSRRGVVLAVSSKNNLDTAEAVFRDHPEMVLRREDIAAFEANWEDKPSALRRIARDLELGIDSLVFFDDNPAERELVRRTLPEVAVPEVPDAPELYVQTLADAGYFEAVAFTVDDAKRTDQYRANAERKQMAAGSTDMDGFLRDLGMVLEVRRFTPVDLPRITQLINKTNQFNLTTRRYTEPEVQELAADAQVLAYAARLRDRFGDNGIIAIIIGRRIDAGGRPALDLDTWLMSCRVLGRTVEQAMLRVVAEDARVHGIGLLLGTYLPSPKNGMVREHYPRLGFAPDGDEGEATRWRLDLEAADLPTAPHVALDLHLTPQQRPEA
ncbi:HAD-IIIC family phosphatase [Aerophototrophica crusticola]|uniref:HAD-IIIC family phosphatase n=1 Tax=Aerophototrophica crusticola TaxID=1709002 RepID=A0A858R822_9PROT|nr:HAD-IIIC family phosphatase [Rhodospirillaceae bacterium B3]